MSGKDLVRRAIRTSSEFVELTVLLAASIESAKIGDGHSTDGRVDWVEVQTPSGTFRLYVSEIAYAARGGGKDNGRVAGGFEKEY